MSEAVAREMLELATIEREYLRNRDRAAEAIHRILQHNPQQEEEIPWAKVAGFDYHSGIFWDSVRIETRGQSSSTVPCLGKSDGQRIRRLLQELEM